jgi:hypothetical protein
MAVMPQLVQDPPLAYEQPAVGATMTPHLSYQPPAIMSRIQNIPGHLLALADGLAGDTNQTQFLDRTMKRAIAGETVQQQDQNDGVDQMKTFDQFLKEKGGLDDKQYQNALHDLQNQMRQRPGARPIAPAPSLSIPQGILAALGAVLDPKNASNNVAGVLGSGIQDQQQNQARMDQQYKLDLSQHEQDVEAAKFAYEDALKRREEAFNTVKEGYSQYAQTYRNDADNRATMDRTKAVIEGQGERQLTGIEAKMKQLEARYKGVSDQALLKIAATGATPEERQNAADFLRENRGINFTPPTKTGGQVKLDQGQQGLDLRGEQLRIKKIQDDAKLDLQKQELQRRTKLSDAQADRIMKEIGWMDRDMLSKIAQRQATVENFKARLSLEQEKISRQDVKTAQTAAYQMAKLLDDQRKKLLSQKTVILNGISMAVDAAAVDTLKAQQAAVEAQIKGLDDQRSRAYVDLKAFESVRKSTSNTSLPAPGGATYDGGVDRSKGKGGWSRDPDGVTRFHGN